MIPCKVHVGFTITNNSTQQNAKEENSIPQGCTWIWPVDPFTIPMYSLLPHPVQFNPSMANPKTTIPQSCKM